jgi:excisionase family DNA binding protein
VSDAPHLTVAELAKHWRVSAKLVRKLIACGGLKAHRVGVVVRIAPEEIDRFERQELRSP